MELGSVWSAWLPRSWWLNARQGEDLRIGKSKNVHLALLDE